MDRTYGSAARQLTAADSWRLNHTLYRNAQLHIRIFPVFLIVIQAEGTTEGLISRRFIKAAYILAHIGIGSAETGGYHYHFLYFLYHDVVFLPDNPCGRSSRQGFFQLLQKRLFSGNPFQYLRLLFFQEIGQILFSPIIGNNIPDLHNGEIQSAKQGYQPRPFIILIVIQPVAVLIPLRWAQNPLFLIITKRFYGQTGYFGKLSYFVHRRLLLSC